MQDAGRDIRGFFPMLEALERRRLLSAIELAADVDPRNSDSAAGVVFASSSGLAYFVMRDAEHGQEVWRSDGTPEGTTLLRDIVPGPADSYPGHFVESPDGTVYFLAFNRELWATDGTPEGTRSLNTVAHPPPYSPTEGGIAVLGDAVLFPTNTAGIPGLSRFDDAGTSFLKPTRRVPEELVSIGEHVYFIVDSLNDPELWRTDGTEAGTVRVHTTSGPNPSIHSITRIGADVYFGVSGSNGDGVWKTDGTPEGTSRFFSFGADRIVEFGGKLLVVSFSTVYELDPAGGLNYRTVFDASAQIHHLTVVGRTLYFTTSTRASAHLWTSDGTSAGTRRVTGAEGLHLFWEFAAFNGEVYFSHKTTSGAPRLWKTNGTPAGTVPVGDAFYANTFHAGPNRLFFFANDLLTGQEPWATNGTPVGTWRLTDAGKVPFSGFPDRVTKVGDHAYFTQVWPANPDKSLYRTDGTPGGTHLVKSIGIHGRETTNSDAKGLLADVDGTLFFAGSSLEGVELWKSDGTEISTVPVADIVPGITPIGGGRAVFRTTTSTSTSHTEVWVSDGSTAGTMRLYSGGTAEGFATDQFPMVGGVAYFSGTDPGGGRELWRTDGTSAGTYRALDLNPGTASSDPQQIIVGADGLLYFTAGDGAAVHLYASDGTPAGTRKLRQLVTLSWGTSENRIVTGSDAVYFFDDGALWRTDGTPASTVRLHTLPPDARAIAYAVNDGLLYFALHDRGKNELWRTDGTPAGTSRVKQLPAGPASPGWPMVSHDGMLYFLPPVSDGREFWQSDGTEAGTIRLTAWSNVTGDFRVPSLTALNGRLLFTAADAEHGHELFTLGDFAFLSDRTLVVRGSAGDDTITIAPDGSALHVTRDGMTLNFSLSDIDRVLVSDLGGDDVLDLSEMSSIGIVLTGPGNDEVFVRSGTFDLSSDLALDGRPRTVRVGASGELIIRSAHLLPGLHVEDGGAVTIKSDDTTPMILNAFSIGPQGRVDVGNSQLVVTAAAGLVSDTLQTLTTAIASARNAAPARWTGPGLTSSAAAANPLTTLAVGLLGDDIVVKHTYNGDANLDGRVNADDYFRIDQGFLAQPTNPAFAQGDFNYDGRVNADDYFLIDQAFLGQRATLASAAASIAASPETSIPHRGTDDDVTAVRRKRASVARSSDRLTETGARRRRHRP